MNIINTIINYLNRNHKISILLAFTCVFSFLVNYMVGSNGVYPVDTFIHYDNGYRILLGDDPIKDYWIVHGLLIDYLQSIFFYIFGNNWISYLIHSSLLNVAIAIFSIYVFLTLKIKFEYLVIISISVSLLAYPVSGSPFLDLHSTFFSLFAFYFIILWIIKKKNYFWFFVSFFLCLAFFSKQVPAAYFILTFSFLNLIFAANNKDLKIVYFYIFGAFAFLILLIFFLFLREVDLGDFILQIFLFPKTIGLDRYSNYILNFHNTLSEYKFVYIILFGIITLNILFFKKIKNYFASNELKILIAVIFFVISNIVHQFYTKNQIYIFYLIPLLTGFLIYFSNSFNIKKKKIIIYSFIILCLFSTIKYSERYNLDRKFHELEYVEKNNSIKISSFSKNFKGLNWISPYFKNPNEELEIMNNLYEALKNDQANKMLITEYNFFSSILGENLNSPSRTYDDISYPKKNTLYYESYKNFLINKIVSKKIQNLYVFEPKNINQERLDHLIFDYVSKDCFEIKDINSFIKKLVVRKCNEFKN